MVDLTPLERSRPVPVSYIRRKEYFKKYYQTHKEASRERKRAERARRKEEATRTPPVPSQPLSLPSSLTWSEIMAYETYKKEQEGKGEVLSLSQFLGR